MKKYPFLFMAILLITPVIRGQSGSIVMRDTPVPLDLLIDDFEDGVPFAVDAHGNGLGLVPWGDMAENVLLSATRLMPYSRYALPGREAEPNVVLGVACNITGWGGFTHAFTDGTAWTSMDWTAYNALSLWVYGNHTGGQIQIDIFDNRNPALNGDSAERYFYRISDDYSGWRQFTIPFALFKRRTDFQPGGAPNDGFGLNEVSGYALGFPANVGPQIRYIDDVGLTAVTDTSALIIVGEREEAVATVDTSITWDSRQWQLVWSDEFEGAAGTPVNPDNWTHEIGGHGWGNNELEYYTNRVENAALDGAGHLAIVAREENPGDYACHYGPCRYTSARLVTRDKVEFTYGRVEARLKIPRGQGIWPAFWMLGAKFPETPWPNCGEMDIMENVGKEPRMVHGTVHGPGYSGANGIGAGYTFDRDVADEFHVFAIDWDPDAIRWYVDGHLYYILTPADLDGREWVFDGDFFILLNVAVGGNWPGSPDDTTQFPQTMLVDYVRVYELVK